MRRKPVTSCPKDFSISDVTATFLANEYPQIEAAQTVVLFKDKATALGWLYADWNSAFRNYIRRSKDYGGVAYKTGRQHDPRWTQVLALARDAGFDPPSAAESPQGYKTRLEQWLKRAPVASLDLQRVLKRV